MRLLVIPTINNNDAEAKLVTWLKESGATIRQGDILATLETTKAVFEFEAESAGILQCAVEAGKSYEFGTTIGYLFENVEEQRKWLDGQKQQQKDAAVSYQITSPA